ncbi:hypothetical protein AMK32_35785 [Streptomyces sp. CB01883]|nr:hypothetical protein AMK32_35785 [Streptomyces sp. CB01883]
MTVQPHRSRPGRASGEGPFGPLRHTKRGTGRPVLNQHGRILARQAVPGTSRGISHTVVEGKAGGRPSEGGERLCGPAVAGDPGVF